MKKTRPFWWGTFVGWVVATLVFGIVGIYVSIYLGAPGYFGGTVGLVLTGLIGLFALAARIAGKK